MKNLSTLLLLMAGLFQSGCSENRSLSLGAEQPSRSTVGTPAAALTGPEMDALIEPGNRIGPIHLGMDFGSAFSILGKPTLDHEYGPPTCVTRLVDWVVKFPDGKQSLLRASFSSQGKIVQLKAELEGFSTKEGTESGDSLKDFKSKYGKSGLVAYADRGLKSNSKYIEGYSAYIVDSERGAAFEFAKSRQDGVWYLDSVYVFDPKDNFSDLRYCDPSEKAEYWIRLSTLDLDSAPELTE